MPFNDLLTDCKSLSDAKDDALNWPKTTVTVHKVGNSSALPFQAIRQIFPIMDCLPDPPD